jgi:hypothetical protein
MRLDLWIPPLEPLMDVKTTTRVRDSESTVMSNLTDDQGQRGATKRHIAWFGQLERRHQLDLRGSPGRVTGMPTISAQLIIT